MEVETSIVRTILHKRNIPKDIDIDDYFDPMCGCISRWEMFNFASTFFTKEMDSPCEPEKRIARRMIYRTEDHVLINGEKSQGISGMLETPNIKKRGLREVLKENSPCIVLSSSRLLNPRIDGVTAIYSIYVPKCQYLVIPTENGKVSPKIAEFVVSQDIEEKRVVKSENPADFDRPWMHIVNEWVAIEIHNFNKIIKVVR